MELPTLAQPVMRKISFSAVMGGVTPQRLECGPWIGTAPFCNAHCSACGPNQVCQRSDCGDGSCCWSGKKVRCCTEV